VSLRLALFAAVTKCPAVSPAWGRQITGEVPTSEHELLLTEYRLWYERLFSEEAKE
jgi:hypothetical protein